MYSVFLILCLKLYCISFLVNLPVQSSRESLGPVPVLSSWILGNKCVNGGREEPRTKAEWRGGGKPVRRRSVTDLCIDWNRGEEGGCELLSGEREGSSEHAAIFTSPPSLRISVEWILMQLLIPGFFSRHTCELFLWGVSWQIKPYTTAATAGNPSSSWTRSSCCSLCPPSL